MLPIFATFLIGVPLDIIGVVPRLGLGVGWAWITVLEFALRAATQHGLPPTLLYETPPLGLVVLLKRTTDVMPFGDH